MFVPTTTENIGSIIYQGLPVYPTVISLVSDVADDPTLHNPPIDSETDAISLAFLISLSVTFAILMVILVFIAAYITFCGADESDYDEEVANDRRSANARRLRNINRPFHMFFNNKHSNILLDSTFTNPGQFDDEEQLLEREEIEFKKMSSFEIELYKRAKELQKMTPPITDEFGSYLNQSDTTFIKDRGIQAFFFLPSINDNIDKVGHFLPSFSVQDKLDVLFTKHNRSSSTVMNYPLPYNKRDAVYFEVKIFRHLMDSNSIFSIGLSTVPYPYFRIPGMSNFSIAYESTGKLRINNPFTASTLLPKLEEGDVVGLGYKYKSGTIFITHNGKKLMDVTQNVDIDLFPCIGAFNASYTRTYTCDGLLEDSDNVGLRQALSEGRSLELPEKLQRVHNPHLEKDFIESDEIELQVNLGQIGFVFIEANVKKYAFNSVYGEIGIPPTYNGTETKKDTILQKGEELPPAYIEDDSDLIINDNITLQGNSNTLENYEIASSSYDSRHNHNDTEERWHTGMTSIDEETTVLPSSSDMDPLLGTNDNKTTVVKVPQSKKGKKNKRNKKKRAKSRK